MKNFIELLNSPEHIFLFIINIILFMFASKIVKFFEHEDNNIKNKTIVFRTFNILFFFLHILDIILIIFVNGEYENILLKIGISGLILYNSYFFSILFNHFNKKKFGEVKEIDNKKFHYETYSSRLIHILIIIFVIVSTLIILIKYWGFDSLLETTGILGIFFLFVSLTHSVWSPDLISGLIILNSKQYNEGNIVEFDKTKYLLYKFNFFRTTLLNTDNNHRTSISNKILANKVLDNYTKIASTDGLRDSITYKIGYFKYEEDSDNNDKNIKEKRKEFYKKKKNEIYEMFQEAYDMCIEDTNILINEKISNFEIFLEEAGDFSLHYKIAFYVNIPPVTNTTKKARKILSTKLLVNEKVLESAIINGIDLSTPIIYNKLEK